jgi:acetyl-CoA carboxylase biotin carboxyl carrier protein
MSENDEAEGAMQVDTGLVRELAAMLTESDLSEIEVQDGARRIVVKRKLGAPTPAQVAVAPAPVHVPVAAVSPAVAPAEPTNAAGTVKSPMVGTVFMSSEPGGRPFVAVGDRVEAGATLLIIEAMKVMNPINAPHAGTVRSLLVENAQPVEYDQPLVVID